MNLNEKKIFSIKKGKFYRIILYFITISSQNNIHAVTLTVRKNLRHTPYIKNTPAKSIETTRKQVKITMKFPVQYAKRV